MPAAPRPETDPPDASPEAPPRKFRHVRPVDEEPGEVTRHGHGSGCIPVIVIRLSILAILVYIVCLIAGLVFANRAQEEAAPSSAPPPAQGSHA